MKPLHRRLLAGAAVLLLLAAGLQWLLWRAAQPQRITLRLYPVVGDAPLVLNEARYPNPGGPGRFAVRDFQFFLSNIRLLGVNRRYTEADSYHLVRFDGAGGVGSFDIVLTDVPRGRYEVIEFGLGVDPAANGRIEARGDLDPNGRMAWTWDVGYKFVLFEGTLEQDGRRQPLVYHVGFSENYATLRFPLEGARLPARMDFRVDLRQMFGIVEPLDMAALPSVKFDHADAARLAGYCATMITPRAPADAGATPH